MGTFTVPIQVGDMASRSFSRTEALVHTGASHTVLPREVLEELGVASIRKVPFVLADDRVVEYEVGQARLRLDGVEFVVSVLFGDPGSQPLLGATTLEIFNLGVDPIGQRLIPVPGLLKGLRWQRCLC